MRHGVPVAHLESEEEYFHLLDAELIEKMRERAAADEERRRMAEASRIGDPKILEELQNLGYTHKTIQLLPLVPLVELAWVDGEISPKEREGILAIAAERGIAEGTPAYQGLEALLERQPPEVFFAAACRGIRAGLEGIPPAEQEVQVAATMQAYRDFANATCARTGWSSRICAAKRHLLEEIAARLRGPRGGGTVQAA